MARVYYKPVDSYSNTGGLSLAAKSVLETLVLSEGIKLEDKIALKVHFGERGNVTFIGAANYDGIVEYLKGHCIDACFTETNALYKGERTSRLSHVALAKEHGFTALPIVIGDGVNGEDYTEVEINRNHFEKCKIGRFMAEQKQMLVIAHFKGHMLAGFGGAIKQLGMGCASRPGKLDQHASSQPGINPEECKKCESCLSRCPRDAIEINPVLKIDREKCIGCAACIPACPNDAITIDWTATSPKVFREKLAEYAYAAHKGKNNIYINYAMNLTNDCDCDGRAFTPVYKDLGVFASMDPVALDTACLEMLNKREGKDTYKGADILDYAEEIGLGTMEYELIGL